MIEVLGLTHRYGPLTAVDDLTFAVGHGEIVGLLGANGAGKSTTLRCIVGLLTPTRGRVLLRGCDVADEPVAAKTMLGYLPENVALPRELTVGELLSSVAGLRGVHGPARSRAVERVISECGLEPVARRLIGYCSRGFRQRIGLAQALIGDAPILVLDEPTVGLDPAQVVEMRQLIQELARDRAVLLSTHILPEANLLCSRVLILHAGRLVAEGPPDALASREGERLQLRLTCEDEAGVAAALLAKVAGVARAEAKPPAGGLDVWHLEVDRAARSADIVAALVGGGCRVHEIRPRQLALETVFLGLVRREDSAGGEEIASDGMHSPQGDRDVRQEDVS